MMTSRMTLFLTLTFSLGLMLSTAHPQEVCPQEKADLIEGLNQITRGIVEAEYEWPMYSRWLTACVPQIRNDNIQACSKNLTNYALQKSLAHQEGHSMRFVISNEEYLQKSPPGALELPEDLKQGLTPGWRERANAKGWKYIEFFSPSIGFSNPEDERDTYRRLVFLVPNDRGFQKWIQFVPPQTQDHNIENAYHIDLIAIDKDSSGKNRQHHNQFTRERTDLPFQQKRLADLNSCLSCHSSGPRVIRPWPGYVTEGNVAAKDLEKVMLASRNSNWGNVIDPQSMGPAIGKKQGCTTCHGGPAEGKIGTFGFISGQIDPSQIHHKMVQSLQMPPSFLEQKKFTALKSVIDRLESMPNSQKLLIHSIDWQNYEAMMTSMNKHKLLSDDEYLIASQQLTVAREEATANYEQLLEDQKASLRDWLSGQCH